MSVREPAQVETPPTPVAFEYRPDRPIPEEIELCARCLQGIVFRRGASPGLPYCPKCGAEAPGIAFTRKSA